MVQKHLESDSFFRFLRLSPEFIENTITVFSKVSRNMFFTIPASLE